MLLEGEQCQAHVGENEILSQEVEDLKKLQIKTQIFVYQFGKHKHMISK